MSIGTSPFDPQNSDGFDTYEEGTRTYIGFDGVELRYADGDTNESLSPVLVIPGGGARDPRYLGDLAGLSTRKRLIVPFLRGTGDSPMAEPETSGSAWKQAEDVERLREHLGFDRVTIVAHSSGTRIALAYAAQFGDRVERLVLITPPVGYLLDGVSDVPARIAARRGDPAFDAAVVALEAGPEPGGDEEFGAWQRASGPAAYARWGVEAQKHVAAGRWNRAATTALFSVVPPTDLYEKLTVLRAPVLVMAGADDCLVGHAPVIALANAFPAGESVTIAECGHYPWVEEPAAFRQALDSFLDRPIESVQQPER